MAKKSSGQSESPERGSPSRSMSKSSSVAGKSSRARSCEAAAGQETRAPKVIVALTMQEILDKHIAKKLV